MKTLKQLFCRHNWKQVAVNNIVNERVNKCTKCGLFWVFHLGIMASYKTEYFPKGPGWMNEGDEA